MVIYQKQHRLAHRQYCVPLSESRLTRFPPPSKKAFFPSSHIFHVNSKCIIKTLFSSKCSSINFRVWLRLKGRDEETSAPERGTAKVAALRSGAAAAECGVCGGTAPRSQPGSALSLIQPCQRAQSRAHTAASHPRSSLAGGETLAASPAPRLGEWSSNSYSHLTSLPRPRGLCYLHPCRAKQMMPRAVLMPHFFYIYRALQDPAPCNSRSSKHLDWPQVPSFKQFPPNTNITSHKKSPGKASMGCDSINQN